MLSDVVVGRKKGKKKANSEKKKKILRKKGSARPREVERNLPFSYPTP